jgi:hypothetical protein
MFGPVEHKEMPTLAEPRRGGPDCLLEQLGHDLRLDRAAGVVAADHAAATDDFGEFHDAILPNRGRPPTPVRNIPRAKSVGYETLDWCNSTNQAS